MRGLIILCFLITTSLAQAMTVVCESTEQINDKPILRFKVNPPRDVTDKNGDTWNHFLIGVTPHEGFRQIIYGSGSVDERQVALTFVKDGFVLGSVQAYSNADGELEGMANISGVNSNRALLMKCGL